MAEVLLRDVTRDDVPHFFEHQLDETAQRMVAFNPRAPADRDAYIAHWTRLLDDDSGVEKTILVDGAVAGYVVCFTLAGRREVGYWIGREFWGRGIASRALAAFLRLVVERPLYAGVARDNVASVRVLEKCGFTIVGEDREFSKVRNEEIEVVVLVLE